MTTFNVVDGAVLVIGIACLAVAYRMDATSSFDNGSSINQMILTIAGIALVGGAAILKIIELFVR